jgi:site-specific DNA-methyltransferase (adenine-specific)
VICSPPYKEKDGFCDFIHIFTRLYNVLKDDSLFFLNFGHLKEDKFRPFEVCKTAISAGFELNDTIVWIKNHFTPLQGNNLNNLSEFIFMLYKGKMPNIDRLSIGTPYLDKSNAKRWKSAGGKDLRCGGNIWYIDIPTITDKKQRAHKDEFPQELPERCIKLANLPKDSIILDCFAGGGSTCLAAKNLGFNYIGIEKVEKNCEIARKRLCLTE